MSGEYNNSFNVYCRGVAWDEEHDYEQDQSAIERLIPAESSTRTNTNAAPWSTWTQPSGCNEAVLIEHKLAHLAVVKVVDGSGQGQSTQKTSLALPRDDGTKGNSPQLDSDFVPTAAQSGKSHKIGGHGVRTQEADKTKTAAKTEPLNDIKESEVKSQGDQPVRAVHKKSTSGFACCKKKGRDSSGERIEVT